MSGPVTHDLRERNDALNEAWLAARALAATLTPWTGEPEQIAAYDRLQRAMAKVLP